MYKSLFLVGINETKDQVLITFRYRLTPTPVIQLVYRGFDGDKKLTTLYSDVSVEHTNKRIEGGVLGPMGFSPTLPFFSYDRETLKLKFYFEDLGASCEIMTDTAMPFIQLIARM